METSHDRGSPRVLGVALFVALCLAALIVTGIVVRAKTPDLILEAPSLPQVFTPNGPGKRAATITFFVRESEADATVEIVDADGETVRILDRDAALVEDRHVTYRWNGRTELGGIAPYGRYRLRVTLPSQDREIVFPRRIEVQA
jgi:FlgD Ig-like domain